MTNTANDIFQQASQGSVAAIIQVLNTKLADSGVRTRAILADGILQLLCEAHTAEQLEASILVERVRQILEAIAPRGIRRVNLNSRIVREQQLLWLEEISRDPQGQLLWAEEIILKQPHPFQRFLKDRRIRKAEAQSTGAIPKSARQLRDRRQFQRGGIIGGVSALLLLLVLGGLAYSRWGSQPAEPVASVSPIASPTPEPAKSSDPFARAVKLAEQSAQAGQSAQSSAEWLALAARWQEASDLMGQVPSSDGRYQTAQNRVVTYRQNSESALTKAKQ